jgi:hypothetical protein
VVVPYWAGSRLPNMFKLMPFKHKIFMIVL